MERHTRGGGKGVDDDDGGGGREVEGGVNSWILMKTGGNVHVIVLFLLIKCYLAQDLGLFTSASLAPEGSVRTEGKLSQWKQKNGSGLICIYQAIVFREVRTFGFSPKQQRVGPSLNTF